MLELLQAFTKKLYELDPQLFRSPKENEYEAEALSILSRFHEKMIISVDNKTDDLKAKLAYVAVYESFDFWFDGGNSLAPDSVKQVSEELLKIYVKAYENHVAKAKL